MKAMILAAGQGTRLQPLTLACPKPMVPLANTPLLVRTLRLLQRQDIVEAALNLYHRSDVITSTLGDGSMFGVRLEYSVETALMGTAGGVKDREAFFDEPFLVLYGDNLYNADFTALLDFHRERNALATIATFTAENPSACGLVVADSCGRVERFQEKPPPEEVFTDCANAGVYILDPEVFSYIPQGIACDFGVDIFPALLAQRPGTVFSRPLGGYLQDTGTIAAYRQANWDLIEGRVAGDSAESGIAGSARVDPSAQLSGRCIIGAGSVVGARATIDESILWDSVIIGEHANVTGAILGFGVRVGDGATVGSGTVAADYAIIDAEAIVPPNTRIAPGETFLGGRQTLTTQRDASPQDR